MNDKKMRKIKLDGGVGIGSLDTKHGVSAYFKEKSKDYVDGTMSYENFVADIIKHHKKGVVV